VPFFIRCRPAWATGIGERLTELTVAPLDLVVAVPRRRVGTAWAYANALPPRAHRKTGRRSQTAGARYLRTLAKSLSCHVSNDFEAGVAAAVPDVARLKKRLEELGAMATVMSGSGSAVVGMFDSRASAEAAARAFSRPDRAWAVRSLGARPRQ
jgi:4-diphosphocytidyl-2-C-methyl-D-erythritol kinase